MTLEKKLENTSNVTINLLKELYILLDVLPSWAH